jgi:putative oxidoreductase
MLVRRIARPLLAAPFVYGGISTLRKPQDRVPGARPVVEKIADTADKQLPVQLPTDVEQWVKADAAVKVVAGSLFALGKFPRLTALVLAVSIVPTTLAGHRFWEHTDPTERFGQISNFLKNGGLLGGLLLAAVDTQGKPGLAYRAHLVNESAHRTARQTRREARHLAHSAAREAKLKAAQAHNAIG